MATTGIEPGAELEAELEAVPRLSADELVVLTLIGRGHTDETIARTMGMSPRTVRRRLERTMTHLDARTRTQAVVQAVKEDLIG